jgi:hypothetical protein
MSDIVPFSFSPSAVAITPTTFDTIFFDTASERPGGSGWAAPLLLLLGVGLTVGTGVLKLFQVPPQEEKSFS